MKRLLSLALALLLYAPAASCGPESRDYVSPNGTSSLLDSWRSSTLVTGADRHYKELASDLGTSFGGYCLVNDAGSFIAAASDRSMRLLSGEGRILHSQQIAPHFADRFVGGWIEADGNCYWETKQGQLLQWQPSSGTMEMVNPAMYVRLFASDQVSPVSCLRLALAQRVKLPQKWVESRRKQICKQEGGPLALKLYEKWAAGCQPEALLIILAKTTRPAENSFTPGKEPHLPAHLDNLRYAQLSGCLAPWLILQSDLDQLLNRALRDSRICPLLLDLHALSPDLPMAPELISLLKRHSKDSGSYTGFVRCLDEAHVSPERLCPLLRDDFCDIDELIDYYSYTPCQSAVPLLIELLPKHPFACRKALLCQLRVDLGDNPADWKTWLAQPHHEAGERGRILLKHGDSSGLLWLSRGMDEFTGSSTLRLIQRIAVQSAQEVWVDRDRVGLRRLCSPQLDWCWELPSGNSKWPLTFFSKSEYFHGIGLATGESLVESRFDGTQRICYSNKGQDRSLTTQEALHSDDTKALLTDFSRRPPVRYDTNFLSVFREKSTPPLEKTKYLRSGQANGHTSDDSRWQLVAPRDETKAWLSLWDCRRGVARLKLDLPERSMMRFLYSEMTLDVPHCFSPDSRWLAIGTEKLTLVSTEGDAPHTVSTQAVKARSLAFQPKAERLAVGTENELVLMHLPDLKVEQIIRGLGPVNGLAYSPDGSLLAVALQDEIRVYQTNSPWPTQEGQDPQLLSELWTGMRLSGGAAVRLSEAEFKQRLKRWKSETGSDWWDGCPKPSGLPTLPLAALAICGGFLGYSFWSRRRS